MHIGIETNVIIITVRLLAHLTKKKEKKQMPHLTGEADDRRWLIILILNAV